MRDYVKEVMQLASENEEDAFNETWGKIHDINLDIRTLEYQRDVISSLHAHWRLRFLGEEEVEAITTDLTAAERSPQIRRRAMWLVEKGEKIITPQRVLEALAVDNLTLGVQQPLAVIGTILASMGDLRKTDVNTFEYVGEN